MGGAYTDNTSTSTELDAAAKVAGIKGYIECDRKSNIKNFKAGTCQIVNLDSIGEGTHWVAYKMVNPKELWYYDSFGMPPFGTIEDLHDKKGVKVFYNSANIQNSKSKSCGWYCLDFLHKLNGKTSIEDYIDYIYRMDPSPKYDNEIRINKFIGNIKD